MEEKKHGGFRQGAGRPKKKEAEKKKMVSIRLSMNVIKFLKLGNNFRFFIFIFKILINIL